MLALNFQLRGSFFPTFFEKELRTGDLAFKPQHKRASSTKTKQGKYKPLDGLHDIKIDIFFTVFVKHIIYKTDIFKI